MRGKYENRNALSSEMQPASELDDIVRQTLEELFIHRAEIIHELIQIYTTIGSNDKIEEAIAKCKVGIEDVLRRKDKLLDLSIDGRISDDEFTTRNNRFNDEIEQLQQHLQGLEEEKTKNQDMMQSIEVLRKAITKELSFEKGFTPGVIDALLDHIEVSGTEDKDVIHVKVYLKAIGENQEYTVQRFRGKTSVCSRQYT